LKFENEKWKDEFSSGKNGLWFVGGDARARRGSRLRLRLRCF
jgi:hypothetical protein